MPRKGRVGCTHIVPSCPAASRGTQGVTTNLAWGFDTVEERIYTFTSGSGVKLNPSNGDRGHLTDLLAFRHFFLILPFYGSQNIAFKKILFLY